MALTKISTGMLKQDAASSDLNIDAGTLYLDVSNNRVGVGTTAPAFSLDVQTASGDTIARFKDSDSSHDGIRLGGDINGGFIGNDSGLTSEAIYFQNSINSIRFYANAAERMRIDSLGRLYLGTTSTTPAFSTSTGMHFAPAGESMISGGNNTTLFLNRTTGDGSILDFRKDGTTVGSIGTVNGDMYLGTGDTGLFFSDASNYVMPYNPSTPGLADGLLDLGRDTNRFKDVWLSNGIQGSSTMYWSLPHTSGGALRLEFGNYNNTARRTVQFYKDNVEPLATYTDLISLGQSTNRFKDLHLSGQAYASYFRPAPSSADFISFSSGNLRFATGSSERVRIDSSGNVGIGTTSPASLLHVKDATNISASAAGAGQFRVEGSGYTTSIAMDATRAHIYHNSSSRNLSFGTNESIDMTIKGSNGFVGIGIESPLDLLHIKSSTTDARQIIDGHTGFDAELKFAENGTVKYTVGHDAATDNFVIGTANVDTQQRLVIDSAGLVGIGTDSPLDKLYVQDGDIGINNTSGRRYRLISETGGGFTIRDQTAAAGRLYIDTSGKIQIGNNIPMWSGSYGGALVLKGNNATADRYAQLAIVDSTGSIVNQGLIVDNGGNVGIGTDSPGEKLVVKGDGARMTIESADMEIAMIGRRGSSGAALDSGYLRLRNQGVTADGVVLDSGASSWLNGGNVGIGTASPSYKLDVYGTDDITMRIHRPSSGLAATDTCGIGFSHRGDANTSTSDTRAGIFSTYNGTLFLATEPSGNLNSNPMDHAALTILGSDQNVGIGTSSPGHRFHVVGNSSNQTAVAKIERVQASASNNTYTFEVDSSAHTSNMTSGGAMAVDVNGGRAFTINGMGNVGIGTTSPGANLHIGGPEATPGGTAGTVDRLHIQPYSNTGGPYKFKARTVSGSSDFLDMYYGSTHIISYGLNGNVGIGTTSPASLMHLKVAGTTGTNVLSLENDSNKYDFRLASANLVIRDGSSDRVTLDSSGNLLVGKTSAGFANTGHELRGGSYAAFTRDGGSPVLVNRKSSDGTLVEYMKDGTTVGSIGAKDGDIVLGTGDTGLRFIDGSDAITPHNISTNAGRDNAIDLGTTGARFKDLYLSGGAYLGGTGAANKLDDYEEGTFSPTIATTSSNMSYSSQFGAYTKVGRAVHFTLAININVVTSNGSGFFEIGGMPFASASTNINNTRFVCQTYHVDFDGSKYQFYAYTPTINSSILRVLYSSDNASWSVATAANFVFANSDAITICGTYFTDA